MSRVSRLRLCIVWSALLSGSAGLNDLAAGGVATVTCIDRLARSTFDLFAIVKRIANAGRAICELDLSELENLELPRGFGRDVCA